MASLISSTDRKSFENSYLDFFDTFKEAIVIYKTPKKVFANISAPGVYGYGDQSNVKNYTSIPVSGVFSGVVTYSNDQINGPLSEANERLSDGEVMIEVSGDARNYINDGVTSLIDIAGVKFTTKSSESRRDFLGLEFYSFKLKVTD
jgi:hypothetical protein